MKTHEYAFDIKLAAVVRVKAASEKKARAYVLKYLDCVDLSNGEKVAVKGDVVVTEASAEMDDVCGPFLFEVDGEPVEGEE